MFTKEKLLKAVVEKAAKDPVFKKQLLQNPNATMKKFFKDVKEISPEILKGLEKTNYKFYIEKENEMTIVFPHELTEERAFSGEELKKVVGGGAVGTWVNWTNA
jgi:hypothetical protein